MSRGIQNGLLDATSEFGATDGICVHQTAIQVSTRTVTEPEAGS